MRPCPPRDLLELFVAGEVSLWDFEPLEAHIEYCASCQALLEEITRPDNLAWLLPELGLVVAETSTRVKPELPGYTILGEGRWGAHGVVYQAIEDAPLGRFVAIKVLRDGIYARTEARDRLLAEARAIAGLSHPNIVGLLAVAQVGSGADARPALILEWVDGGPLADCLHHTPQPERAAAALIQALAGAVAYAHRAGVLHRDIKPGNILLPGPGLDDPKLGDFGLAKLRGVTGDWSASSAGLGTPPYMAPELVTDGPRIAGPSADVYALGAVLYEVLTGQPPFQATTPFDTLLLVRFQEPVSPRTLRPNLSRDLETICLKCLEKEPDRRYETAEQLGEDLQRFLRGEPVHARPIGRFERMARWCRRNPAVAALSSSFLLALILGLVTVTMFWRDAERGRLAARKFLVSYAPLAKSLFQVRGDLDEGDRRRFDEAIDQALALLAEPTGTPAEMSQEAFATLELANVLHYLREYKRAQVVAQSAVATLRALSKADPGNLKFAHQYAQGCVQLSSAFEKLGEDRAAIDSCREAIRIADRLATAYPQYYAYAENAASWRGTLSVRLARRGEIEEAEKLQQAAIVIHRSLVEQHPDEPQRYLFYGNALNIHARFVLLHRADVDRYLLLTKGIADCVEALRDSDRPQWVESAAALSERLNDLPLILDRIGRVEEARVSTLRGLEWARDWATHQPRNVIFRWCQAATAFEYGILLQGSDPAAATPYYRETLEILEPLAKETGIPLYRARWAEFLALCPDPKLRDPERALDEAMRIRREYPDHDVVRNVLPICYYEKDRLDEVVTVTSDHPNRSGSPSSTTATDPIVGAVRAMALWRLGREVEAKKTLRKASDACNASWFTSRREWFIHDRAWKLIEGSEPLPRKPPPSVKASIPSAP